VSPDQSVLDALKDHGIHVDTGCQEGVCGSCLTGVLEGEVDHRDSVLDDQDRARNRLMCVCVSRARSDRLVLDL
jgi:vanillate O-demethylase ferredoxin subunit